MLIISITIILLLPISATAQSYSNITLGSSLVANSAESDSTWLSPSAEFAFGFRQVEPGGGYLLAIWFDKIPEKTIIWSANRNNLAPQGSRIQLVRSGRLELIDPRGQEIWAADSAVSDAAYAAMLDNGNFVLASSTAANVWQSFNEPTDTLVPTQTLNKGGELISSFSETNYSQGRFYFQMQPDGNLVWYTRNFPMSDAIRSYLATGTVGEGFSFIFNESGYLNLIAQNGTVLSNLYRYMGASTQQYYQRLTLEYDGVLRHYLYPKSANSTGGRPTAWSVYDLLPVNICTQITQDTGGGACGLNSICSLGEDERPRCSCPFGYSVIDSSDWKSGCKRDFAPQSSCDEESNENGLFIIRDMPDTDWPLSDYAHFKQVTEDWCRQDCLNDCFCDVAIFRNGDCWKKRVPLSNGRMDSSVQGKALVKIRRNNTAVSPDALSRSSRSSALIITVSVLLGSSVVLNILFLLSRLFFASHFVRRKSRNVEAKRVYPGVNIRCFSFNELQEATNGFKEELGNGAYSTVYKGTLRDEDGKVVAVKKLNRIVSEADYEFRAEVSSISRTSHKNLVQLLGYCDEEQHRLLVYEFMSNGSLGSFLFNKSAKPNWYTRVQIAFAVARGLCYLHHECSTQILHCDIKPQNVLLDDSFTAKISDFGLAKLLRADQSRTLTRIRGTRGYVAPEWFRSLPVTVKVDVYSYGIMLLELLCCRKTYEPDCEDEGKQILVDWAYDCYKGAMLHLLVGEEQEMIDEMTSFERLVKIAIWCVQEDPQLRPQMKRVVHMLEGSIEVPPPPDPAVSFIC